MVRTSAVWLLVALAGCAHQAPSVEYACKPTIVNTPIPVKAIPELSLLAPLTLPDVRWLVPDDAAATSCVKAEGEQQLLDFFDSCVTRQGAWRAWAIEPSQ